MANALMRKIYCCPGKVNIKSEKQLWYIPGDKNNNSITYCESCFKEYSKEMETIQFYLETGKKKHHCCYEKDFSESSLTYGDIRISIVDPTTFYRYRLRYARDNYMKVGLPNNTEYMIVIENCQKNPDTKINIEKISCGSDEYSYHNKLKNSIVISSIKDELGFIYREDDIDNNMIIFTINKWSRHPDKDLCQYFALDEIPVKIVIELVRSDSEYQNMNKVINYYEKLENDKDKIIIIDNFV